MLHSSLCSSPDHSFRLRWVRSHGAVPWSVLIAQRAARTTDAPWISGESMAQQQRQLWHRQPQPCENNWTHMLSNCSYRDALNNQRDDAINKACEAEAEREVRTIYDSAAEVNSWIRRSPFLWTESVPRSERDFLAGDSPCQLSGTTPP